MNAETLRQLTLTELLDELDRAVRVAKTCLGSMRRVGEPSEDPLRPLVSICDFDIYPRNYLLLRFQQLLDAAKMDVGAEVRSRQEYQQEAWNLSQELKAALELLRQARDNHRADRADTNLVWWAASAALLAKHGIAANPKNA